MVAKSKRFKILVIFGYFFLAIFLVGPLGPPWGPLGAPFPYFGSQSYSPLKYLQNETNTRLIAQSIHELLRKQGELSKNEGPPPGERGGGSHE